jgi:hypothetical protein
VAVRGTQQLSLISLAPVCLSATGVPILPPPTARTSQHMHDEEEEIASKHCVSSIISSD